MKKSNVVTSFFALFSFARIDFVGQLFGFEILELILFPYRKIGSIFKEYPILTKLSIFYLLLLVSLMFSDIVVNKTMMVNFLRGWANIIFSLITTIFLTYQLSQNKKNVAIYMIFFGISFFIFRDKIDTIFYAGRTDIFKVYYMLGINAFILVSAYFLNRLSRKIPVLLFFTYAIVCFVLDARSNGVIYFISSLILAIKASRIKLTKLKLIFVSLLFVVVLSLSYVFYVDSVLSGRLKGNNTQQLKHVENPYNPLQLLIMGRTEVFVSFQAIKENPYLGYGSWAEDPTGKYARMQAAIIDSDELDDSSQIMHHSVLFTAWLWAGLGGLLGALLIFGLMTKKGLFVLWRSTSPILIMLTPLVIEMLWNFLFSPIGRLRDTFPIVFAIIIVEYYRLKKNELPPKTV